jgi:hypothetical protein
MNRKDSRYQQITLNLMKILIDAFNNSKYQIDISFIIIVKIKRKNVKRMISNYTRNEIFISK